MAADRSREHERREASHRFECVEPEIGDRLWRLDDPLTPSGELERLHAHLSICHACRLHLAVDKRLERSLRSADSAVGGPVVKQPKNRTGGPGVAGSGAALLLAACFTLVFVLPPRQATPIVRSADSWGISRPVPGEVVATPTPRITWMPLTDARAYRVTVAGEQNGFFWQVETSESQLRVPETAALPRSGRFRVTVHPLPTYLAPPAGCSSWLRTGSLVTYVGYRLVAAPKWVHWLGLVACATLVVAGVRRIVRP